MTRASQLLMQLFMCFPALPPSFSPGGGPKLSLRFCDPGAPRPGSLSLPCSKGALLLSHTFRSLSRVSGRVLKVAPQSHRLPRLATLPPPSRVLLRFHNHSYRREGYYSTRFEGCQGFLMSFGKSPQRHDGDASSPRLSTRSLPRARLEMCIFRTDARESISPPKSHVKEKEAEFSPGAKTRFTPGEKEAPQLSLKRSETLSQQVSIIHKTHSAEPLDRKMVLLGSGRGSLANKCRPACHTTLRLLRPLVPRVTLVAVARLAQQRASSALVRSRGEWLSLFTNRE